MWSCGDRTGLLVDPGALPPGFASTSASTSTSHPGSTSTSTSRLSSTTSRPPSTSTQFGSTTAFTTSTASVRGSLVFVSGVDWNSFADAVPIARGGPPVPMGPSLGPARAVCVTPTNPVNCPPGAVVYDSPQTPWAVGQQLPTAHWIWRGDVTDTAPADLQTAALQQSYAVGPGASGTLSVGADDLASVYINAEFVGTVGSVTSYQVASMGQFNLTTLDLTAALQASVPNGGTIVVTVVGENGPATFGTACPAQGCDYTQNPAGVIFMGKIVW
jgi:hypothetical protein